MNGWYVEVLLLNRYYIKSNIIAESENFDETLYNFDTDLYEDLLDVERALRILYDQKVITNDELNSLRIFVGDKERDVSKFLLSKNVKTACSKIAYYLGGHFTNEGFIDNLKNSKNLSNEEVERVEKYINGSYRLREVILG